MGCTDIGTSPSAMFSGMTVLQKWGPPKQLDEVALQRRVNAVGAQSDFQPKIHAPTSCTR